MANPYHDIVRTKVVAAMGAAKAVAGISHPGLKGKIREILIRDLFRPLLPADIGVGSGQIISYYNNDQSKEQDIVLYDRSILPPILFDEFMGLFPIESVLYTIEVKSTLTVAELQKSHESALMLDKFGYLPGQTDESGNPRHHTIEKIRSVLIALDTDLSIGGKSEIERYRGYMATKVRSCELCALLVAVIGTTMEKIG